MKTRLISIVALSFMLGALLAYGCQPAGPQQAEAAPTTSESDHDNPWVLKALGVEIPGCVVYGVRTSWDAWITSQKLFIVCGNPPVATSLEGMERK